MQRITLAMTHLSCLKRCSVSHISKMSAMRLN